MPSSVTVLAGSRPRRGATLARRVRLVEARQLGANAEGLLGLPSLLVALVGNVDGWSHQAKQHPQRELHLGVDQLERDGQPALVPRGWRRHGRRCERRSRSSWRKARCALGERRRSSRRRDRGRQRQPPKLAGTIPNILRIPREGLGHVQDLTKDCDDRTAAHERTMNTAKAR